VLKDPAPLVQTARLNQWAVDIEVKPWVAVGDYVRATGEINREVLAALQAREISIPVPQREVRLIEAASS
jgi:small-conductance mechanosensitive channel